jgi:hypothetical protein
MKYYDYENCTVKWISRGDHDFPIVKLSEKQYDFCKLNSSNMECSNNKGIFGRGLINTVQDPYKVERRGYLGEVAFGVLTNAPTFIGRKKGGDIDDFYLNNFKTDIKATSYPGSMLIKSVNENQTSVYLKSDIYVSAYLIEVPEYRRAGVLFVGYATGDFVKNMPDFPAKKGKHQNKEIPWNKLLPMKNLLKLYGLF